MLSFQAWNWEFFAFIIFSCLEHGMLPNQMLAADLSCLVEKKVIFALSLRQYSSEPGVKVIRFFLKDAVAFLQILEYHWGRRCSKASILVPALYNSLSSTWAHRTLWLVKYISLTGIQKASHCFLTDHGNQNQKVESQKFSGNFFDVRFVC